MNIIILSFRGRLNYFPFQVQKYCILSVQKNNQKKLEKICVKGLTISKRSDIIQRLSNDRHLGVAQLEERYLGVVEAASSSLVT